MNSDTTAVREASTAEQHPMAHREVTLPDKAKPVRQSDLFDSLPAMLAAHATNQPTVMRHTVYKLLNRFAGCNARILLAEDNITNQQVALGILKKLGLSADVVANGAEALKALELIPYDLVLMDVQMPVMDGLEATKRIRNDECGMMNANSALRTHHSSLRTPLPLPIIAITAQAMQGDREMCLEAGMNDYVTKPVILQSLANVLEKWLPKRPQE